MVAWMEDPPIPPPPETADRAESQTTLALWIERESGRARCPSCNLRRVLYRILAQANHKPTGTPPRCAECLGIRR